MGLGSFCHLAAGFVGNMELVHVGVEGPDLLSPCVGCEKHVLGWQLLLESFEEDRALCAKQCAMHAKRARAYKLVTWKTSRAGKKVLYSSLFLKIDG